MWPTECNLNSSRPKEAAPGRPCCQKPLCSHCEPQTAANAPNFPILCSQCCAEPWKSRDFPNEADICKQICNTNRLSNIETVPFQLEPQSFPAGPKIHERRHRGGPDSLLWLCEVHESGKALFFYVQIYLDALLSSSSSTNQEALELVLNWKMKRKRH